MYSTTSAFKAAVVSDHTVVSKAEVWSTQQLLTTLDVGSGTVSIDNTSAVRRTCTVTLTTSRDTTNIVPDNDYDILSPFGNELKLYRGIQYASGTKEYVPLGVFVITEVAISDTNEGVQVIISGEDRSIKVSRAKWTQPYQVTSGTLETALTNLLKSRYPDVITNFPTTNVTINQVVLGAENENNPWKDAVELAELVGYDLYFDETGTAVLKAFPDLDGSVVVALYQEGGDTLITSLDRNISTKETYNGVIYTVEGSGVSTPVRVEVWDEDTTSPTYRYGQFGQVPTFVSTNIVSTSADAIKAASLLLNRYIGSQESITWTALVDPSLDVNDVIYIKTNGAKVNRLVIIDKLEMPLNPQDQLSAQARVVRVVSTNEQVLIGA